MKKVIGPENYDSVAHSGWIKIYSKMLAVIIPIVVKFELANKPVIQKVTQTRMKAVCNLTDTVVLAADANEKSVSATADRMVSVLI